MHNRKYHFLALFYYYLFCADWGCGVATPLASQTAELYSIFTPTNSVSRWTVLDICTTKLNKSTHNVISTSSVDVTIFSFTNFNKSTTHLTLKLFHITHLTPVIIFKDAMKQERHGACDVINARYGCAVGRGLLMTTICLLLYMLIRPWSRIRSLGWMASDRLRSARTARTFSSIPR